jgi:hypothetical protein
VFTAQKAAGTVDCKECGKPRLIYSKFKLTERYKLQLAMLVSEYEYTCGSPLTPPTHPLHGKTLVRLNLDCARPMETSYYSSQISHTDICYYCGIKEALVDLELKKRYKIVYPLCVDCSKRGFSHCCLRPFGKED